MCCLSTRSPRAGYRDFADDDPFPFYERIRREHGPVAWDQTMNGWLVVGYAECAQVERNETLFRHPYAGFDGAAKVKGTRSVLLLSGREHRSMHKFLTSYMSTPEALRAFRSAFIGPLADRLIDAFPAAGQVEFAGQFADRLPINVIAAMLGMDWDDDSLLARCKELNDAFIRWSETFGEDEETLSQAVLAAEELEELLRPVIRARRASPRDDLISQLWARGPALLAGWGEEDVLDQCKTLFPAGGQTTAYFLCNAMYLLATSGRLRDENWADDQAQLANFLDEALRLHGTIHFRVREVLSDTTLAGVELKRGDRVYPVNSAANRDPAKFDHPAELRPGRAPARHLAFNVGPRVCVGEAFARAEAVEAFARIASRLSHIALDPMQPAPRLTGFLSRSFRPLHLRFTARAKGGRA
jgi:cytochrome P450